MYRYSQKDDDMLKDVIYWKLFAISYRRGHRRKDEQTDGHTSSPDVLSTLTCQTVVVPTPEGLVCATKTVALK